MSDNGKFNENSALKTCCQASEGELSKTGIRQLLLFDFYQNTDDILM